MPDKLGEYGFGSYRLLSPSIDTNQVSERYTAVHEITHQLLTERSSMGVLLVCLSSLEEGQDWMCLNQETQRRFSDLLQVFADSCRKVQEGMALLSEWFIFSAKGAWSEADEWRRNLKHNRNYYKYLKPLGSSPVSVGEKLLYIAAQAA